MVLVSAVFFKGLWKDKFHPRTTKMMRFHISRTETHDVRMMKRIGRFPYAEVSSLRMRALEVPYHTGKLAMVLVSAPLSCIFLLSFSKPRYFLRRKLA